MVRRLTDYTCYKAIQLNLDCDRLIYLSYIMSLNYIKQLGLKDNLRLKCCFSMETLECDTQLVRGGHLEGPHVFGFLIHVFPSEIWTQTWKGNYGLENCIFQSE